MLQLRYISEENIKESIDTTNEWLIGWKKNRIDPDLFPTSGLIMEDTETGEEVFIGYTWFSNSKLAQIGFITRNPNYSKQKLAKQNKESFIRELISYCYKNGYNHIITWTDHPILIHDFKKIGFTETSDKTSELIIKIVE